LVSRTRAGIAVLAAGLSTRFENGYKLTELLAGKPVLTWVLDAVAACRLPSAVVWSRPEIKGLAGSDFDVIQNANPERGIAHSLILATGWASETGLDDLVVVLGDQPFISPDCIFALVACRSDLAFASYGGKRGNPVKISSSVFPELPREGDLGARALIGREGVSYELIDCGGASLDIDTRSDLEKAILLLAGQSIKEGGKQWR
jgi:molybdenum cofactor cytidylyltransferase